jgi:hypothetical protein
MTKTNETVKDLRKIERAIGKLRNNLKRADLDFTVQVSIASTDPGVVRYAAQMTAPAIGLAPVTFIADTADQLVEKIKVATKNINYDAVEIAYHEAQIQSCERTIVGHKERIEEIKNRPEEEVTEEETEDTTEEESLS